MPFKSGTKVLSPWERLEFRVSPDVVELKPGTYRAGQLIVLLRGAGVINNALHCFTRNQKKEFTIDERSSKVVFADIVSPIRCPMDEDFFRRALLEGLGVLSDGAGPLLACEPFEGSVMVPVKRTGADSVSIHGHILWKIVRRPALTALVADEEMTTVLEGMKRLAFARI